MLGKLGRVFVTVVVLVLIACIPAYLLGSRIAAFGALVLYVVLATLWVWIADVVRERQRAPRARVIR